MVTRTTREHNSGNPIFCNNVLKGFMLDFDVLLRYCCRETFTLCWDIVEKLFAHEKQYETPCVQYAGTCELTMKLPLTYHQHDCDENFTFKDSP